MAEFNREKMRKALVDCGISTLEDVLNIIATDEDEQDAVFNALVFDINAVYGRVLISLDTVKNYENTMEDYEPEDDDDDDDELEMKFNAAEFDYINHGEITLLDFNDMNSSFDNINDGIEIFMDMACEALLELMETDPYKNLPKANEFEALCMDHDAGVTGSRQRLNRVRKTYKSNQSKLS